MSRVFAADSKFMLVLSKIIDVVLLSAMFLICCIPLITIGPALCALYYTCRKVIQRREGYLFREYFRCIKTNFLQSLLFGVIFLFVIALMGVNIFYSINTWKGVLGITMTAVYSAILICVLVLTGYLFPILSRFESKGKQLFRNAYVIALTHLKTSILMTLLLLVFYAGVVASYAFFPILLFVLPVAFGCMQVNLLEKVFAEYMEEESGEEKLQETKE